MSQSAVAQDAPLSLLAQSLMENDVSPSPSPVRSRVDHSVAHMHDHADKECHSFNFWHFLFYFLVFGLVFYFLYFCLRPSFVLEKHCDSRSRSSASDEHDERQISNGRLLAAAVVSALLLIFVFWLFYALLHWLH